MKKDLNTEKAQAAKGKQLEWGAHNAKLTESNFIDRPQKKISDQNELLAKVDTAPTEQHKKK